MLILDKFFLKYEGVGRGGGVGRGDKLTVLPHNFRNLNMKMTFYIHADNICA